MPGPGLFKILRRWLHYVPIRLYQRQTQESPHALITVLASEVVDAERFKLVLYENQKKKLMKNQKELQAQSYFNKEEIFLLDQV